MRRLRILHISDLHERAAFEGMPPSRSKVIAWDEKQRGTVLGEQFSKALLDVAQDGIDMVCLTGDLTDWGMRSEYAKATERLDRILRLVSVPRTRFFAVPGNHDVQRNVGADAWKEIRTWLAKTADLSGLGRWVMGPKGPPFGTKPEWLPEVLQRTEGFWAWLREFRGDELRSTSTEALGYRSSIKAGTFDGIDVPIHILGLDSAWLCGAEIAHDDFVLKDQGGIAVTQEQIDAHIRSGEHLLDGYRIALIHHPLDHLADHAAARRILGDNGVDILLHGHQHEPSSIQTLESGSTLRVLAAGCLVEGDLGKSWPNGFQVIEIDPVTRAGSVAFHKWSSTGRFWARGSDIYRDARDGVLRFEGSAPEEPPGTAVVGRGLISSDLVDALLAADRADDIVHLAFASHGFVQTGATDAPICGTLCLTTDAPERLRKELAEMRSVIAADPLVPAGIKERIAKATLRELVAMPVVRGAALRQLSTTSFSAYLYYCSKRDFDSMSSDQRIRALLVLPLFHRLSKRKQRIESVGSQVPELRTLLEAAQQQVVESYKREPGLPIGAPAKLAILEELASFVVDAACDYLSNPTDANAAEVFANLRTRVRYAENAGTGEKHKRDVNPLP